MWTEFNLKRGFIRHTYGACLKPFVQSKADGLGANGTLHLQVRYLPFVSPELQAEAAMKAERSRHKAIARARKTDTPMQPATGMRGVLTVTVHRCLNLEVRPASWQLP